MLSRNSSSLSRSPTVKSSIDSLSCLEEAIVPSSPNRADKIWTEELSRRPADALTGDPKVGLKARLLLPPLLLLTIPCAWWYAKKASQPNLSRDLSPNLPLNLVAVGFWFDALALSLFFAAFLVSVRVVYRYRTLIYRLFGTLGRDGLSAACLKPVVGLLISDEKDRRRPGRTSSVVWTIGSRSKSERAKIEREGVIVYGNGDVYEGEFHQGRCSGSGVYYFYKSGRYEGQWVDGKYDGYGVETWARGSRYRGQYRKGLREGYGVYRFYTGDIYAGEWSNGQSHGCGVQTCEDGSRYVGEFKWGMKHGFGYYIFRNGDTYAGEYFTDKMHGYGVYQFANGHRYEGGWHEGKRQGLGLYTFRSGETQAGQWHGGVLQILSTHNPLPAGSVDNVVSHAKVLHIVQEARCAAEKAYQVLPVDDRVNRAVAAANRAANAARVASVKAVQKKLYGNTATTDM